MRQSPGIRAGKALWLNVSFRLITLVILAFIAEGASAATNPTQISFEPNLPIIFLQATQQIVSEAKVPGTFRYLDSSTSESSAEQTKPAALRIHGATSRAYPKKSFGVTLETPMPLAGMKSQANWVLNAAYIDRSMMRHKLSYDLFRALARPGTHHNSVDSRFVEVFLNGKYNGLYLLMERVDAKFLGLHPFNSNDLAHACIYKAVNHGADFSQPGHPGFEQREPDPLTRAYWKPLDNFDRFVSSTDDAKFFAETNGISVRLDLDNAIDFHLLVLLTSNMDGTDKNFVLARDHLAPGEPIPKFFFVPWDYDATFGRNWNATRVDPANWLSHHLFDRLLTNAEYRKRFVTRWNELRVGPFDAKQIRKMIDDNARTIGPAAQRNFVRWPVAQGYYPDQTDFEQDVAQMKVWVDARLAWLDQEIRTRFGSGSN